MTHKEMIEVWKKYILKHTFYSTNEPVYTNDVHIANILVSNRYITGKMFFKLFSPNGYVNRSNENIKPLIII